MFKLKAGLVDRFNATFLSRKQSILADPTKCFSFCRARLNMFYTYVLYCLKNKPLTKIFYIGSTSDLKARLLRHKTKCVKTTKEFDKIDLIYYESCLNKTDARKRELQLKTGFGRGYIKRRLETFLKAGGIS